MKKLRLLLGLMVLVGTLAACHPLESYDDVNDFSGNFDALWDIVDQHYCFFAEKGIDWDSIHSKYAKQAANAAGYREFFTVCSAMLNELEDGHVNLSTWFDVSYYRNWWSDYPENFSERVLEDYYFNYNYSQLGAATYGILPDNVGYIRISTFGTATGDSNISWILAYLATCNGLIVDVRNNGGGDMSNAETWARHFITEPITAAYMIHKTGPGHNDFSEPYAITFEPPSTSGQAIWRKPVVVLANRSTYSAANYFVAVMHALPNVTVAGATTGGGSGMPITMEIPCGWSVRMSSVSVLDSEHRVTERGIEPDEGCAVDLDETAALEGRDTMVDFAVGLLK
jgi:hypothetical protein